MNKVDEGRMKLADTLARVNRQIAVMDSTPAPEDVCPMCGDTGWALDETQGLIRCPACQCEYCGGLGYVRYEVPPNDPRFGEMMPCPRNCDAVQRLRAERRDRIQRYTALPAEYAELSFETFDRIPVIARQGKEAARWMAGAFVDAMPDGFVQAQYGEPRNWLYFHGPNGTGKTGMAASIVNALTDRGYQSLYIRWQDFIQAVQARYQRAKTLDGYGDDFGNDTSEDVIAHAQTAAVLVADEFDVRDRDISPDKLSIAEKVVRYRHGNRLPTVITTNLTPDEFEARWGTTIASVVLSRAHCVLVNGPVLRAQALHWGDDN